MRRLSKKWRQPVGAALTIVLLSIAAVYGVRYQKPKDNVQSPIIETKEQISETVPVPTETEPVPTFDKTKYSIDDPASPWVIVNKKRPLPADYAPLDLSGSIRAEAQAALNNLYTDSSASGYTLRTLSGYRSYASQKSIYNGYVAKDGQSQADTYSARPGHSEHQTGWAVDVGNGTCDLEICFGETGAGKWVAAHAHEYGFVVRYLSDKTTITGYSYEPWHLRYVGKDLAKELFTNHQTMEEFFGLPAAPTY